MAYLPPGPPNSQRCPGCEVAPNRPHLDGCPAGPGIYDGDYEKAFAVIDPSRPAAPAPPEPAAPARPEDD